MKPEEQNYWQGDKTSAAHPPISSAPAHVIDGDIPPLVEREPAIAWDASEYIHHEKTFMWYVTCAFAGMILTLLSFFLMRSWSFSALIVVITAALIILGRRPPRTLHYELSSTALKIDGTPYPLVGFKSFGVVPEGGVHSIVLIPVKRFMPSVNLYFPPEHGEEIVDRLGAHLPMERFEPDIVDRFVRKIRF